jgi:hypothetical protein
VTRLRNGFPSTQREEDEFDRRENGLMQDLAQRMGISIQVVTDSMSTVTSLLSTVCVCCFRSAAANSSVATDVAA